MPQTTDSIQQARETAQTMGDLAASALHHIADALELVSQDAAVEWRMREVRQLADAIVRVGDPVPSCDAPNCGCVDGTDCRANVAAEARRLMTDQVMIRAVRRQLGDGHRDDDGNAIWVIDRTATAHRAPFRPGDVIVDSTGSSGFRRVLKVQPHPDVERLLRLVVRRVDGLVFDADEF